MARTDLICGIVGAGGFGREVLGLIDDSIYAEYMECRPNLRVFFVESKPRQQMVAGVPVVSLDDFIRLQGDKRFVVAIADSYKRRVIAETLLPHATPLPIIASSHSNLRQNVVSEGSIFCGFTTVTCNSRIGKFFHGNLYSYIGHDCIIGDYVTFAPAVKCNGHVHIGDHAYIGTGACIRQGTDDNPLTIGEGAVIGMGAVVTRSVDPHTTVVGNPARLLVKRASVS